MSSSQQAADMLSHNIVYIIIDCGLFLMQPDTHHHTMESRHFDIC